MDEYNIHFLGSSEIQHTVIQHAGQAASTDLVVPVGMGPIQDLRMELGAGEQVWLRLVELGRWIASPLAQTLQKALRLSNRIAIYPPTGSEEGDYLFFANRIIENVQHRMPVILHPDHYKTWLARNIIDPTELLRLCRPYPFELLETWPVSSMVNNLKNDSADLVVPVDDHALLDHGMEPEARGQV